jgi:hypothetical protein
VFSRKTRPPLRPLFSRSRLSLSTFCSRRMSAYTVSPRETGKSLVLRARLLRLPLRFRLRRLRLLRFRVRLPARSCRLGPTFRWPLQARLCRVRLKSLRQLLAQACTARLGPLQRLSVQFSTTVLQPARSSRLERKPQWRLRPTVAMRRQQQ